MTKEEKLAKITLDFSTLSEEKQDYILGILQALVFAHEERGKNNEKANYSNNYGGSLCEK